MQEAVKALETLVDEIGWQRHAEQPEMPPKCCAAPPVSVYPKYEEELLKRTAIVLWQLPKW